MKEINKEEVKKLIKNGFDLELISFELDIPIEEIKQYKLDLEKINKTSSVKTNNTRKKTDNKNAHSKMQQVRKRYKKLFLSSNKKEEKNQPKKISEQEIEQINLIITDIEGIVKGIEKLSRKERRNKARLIQTKIKKIEDYQLTIEQAEKLHNILELEELKNLQSSKTDMVDVYMDKSRSMIIRKLTEAIDFAQSETEEIEELKTLKSELTTRMQQLNRIAVDAVRGKIDNKINKINKKKSFDRTRNNVPEDIDAIIKGLVNGTLNIEKANEIINKEAKKRVESKPKTKFTLTEEQQKRQILIQIKTLLLEKAEQYHIENPENTVIQIQELCGGELEQAIRTVVKNLINIKDYETAKKLCDEFYSKNKQSSFSRDIGELKNEIRNNEIGDIILKAINMKATEEEEKKCFDLIEKGINRGNVKLGAIPLGKSKDGSRNIYLSDIWEDKKKTR